MTRQEIEEKVKAFLIDDLEIDEEKILFRRYRCYRRKELRLQDKA